MEKNRVWCTLITSYYVFDYIRLYPSKLYDLMKQNVIKTKSDGKQREYTPKT